jgi:arylsulfatase A-like enzyme
LLSPFLGCRLGVAPAPCPDIVLITIDTLRSDRVSAYGYARQTTPFLDALAGRGVRFATSYSPSSWTVPSMASLFTSLEPDHHGIQRGLVEKNRIVGQEVLAESHILLAEILREAGYRTYGVSANLHLASEFGFAQGFDHYENLGFANADRIAPVLAAWSGELRSGTQPFFLWIHYFDPHDPYYPRAPWFENPVPALAGEVSEADPVDIRRLYWLNSPDGRRRAPRRLKKELRIAKAAYDAEISYTDQQIRQAFETLDLGENDLIVVTADHGEEFYEHGNLGHGQDLHEEQVRVPMILRLPDAAHAGRVVDQPVSLIDVVPSILDYLDLDPPPEAQGTSLLPLIDNDDKDRGPVYLAVSRAEPGLRAVRQGSWKYIRDLGGPRGDRLFDLATDPGERRDVRLEEPAKARQLASQLDEFLAHVPISVQPELEEVDAETLDELRALGYVEEGDGP